jgi:23S rRNA pseudouridine1911/1915/1917 synthase
VPKKLKVIAPKIIFEDNFILVIDKPAGWIVNRAETTRDEETVQDWIESHLKVPREDKVARVPQARNARGALDSRDTFFARSGIVHRLDKETSGILLIANTPQAFFNLQRQFKERKIKKRYLALVHGKITPVEGVIEVPIARSPFDREKFGVFLGGRPARTKYKVKKNHTLDTKRYTLLELAPTTGRTHQIRVHLKFIGHPVVGDEKYAGRKTARADRKWCPRQFLHASYLSFIHPKTGKKVVISSKLPSDLKRIIMTLS